MGGCNTRRPVFNPRILQPEVSKEVALLEFSQGETVSALEDSGSELIIVVRVDESLADRSLERNRKNSPNCLGVGLRLLAFVALWDSRGVGKQLEDCDRSSVQWRFRQPAADGVRQAQPVLFLKEQDSCGDELLAGRRDPEACVGSHRDVSNRTIAAAQDYVVSLCDQDGPGESLCDLLTDDGLESRSRE